MDTETLSELAVGGFAKGYNCAESLIAAFNQYFDDDGVSIALATPFGAGFGARRDLCGILITGAMVIGHKHGRVDPADIDQKTEAYKLAGAYYRWFKEQFGGVMCRDIVTGKFTGHTEVCARIMRGASAYLAEVDG